MRRFGLFTAVHAALPPATMLAAALVLTLAASAGFRPAEAAGTTASSAAGHQATVAHSESSALDASRRAAYEYHVLAGELALQRGKYPVAASEYAAALEYSNDPALARRAGQIALLAHQPALAYRAVQAWVKAEPESLAARRAAARLAFVVGDASALRRYAGALIGGAASPRAAYSALAGMLDDQPGRSALAIDTLQSLAGQNPRSAAAQYALGALALEYGRLDVAARAANRAHELAPKWARTTLLQAGVMIQRDQTDAARALIAKLPGSAEQRAQYHASLAQVLLSASNQGAARDEFHRALKLAPTDNEARYGFAVLALSTGAIEPARRAFETLYDHHAHAADAAYYLGTIFDQQGADAKAERWYARVARTPGSGHGFAAGMRGARVIAAQGDVDRARQSLMRLAQQYPGRADPIAAYEGQLLFQVYRNQEALGVYDRALSKSPNSADLLYGRSIVYERLGRIADAEADLRRVLAAHANDVRALNALGYMLTNHTRQYTRALGLIDKALTADPGNPAIQDSMGWVQYQLGHLQTARRYLEKAYKSEPGPEIAAHLGAVRWKQGARQQARRVWQQASSDDPDNPVLRDVMRQFGQ